MLSVFDDNDDDESGDADDDDDDDIGVAGCADRRCATVIGDGIVLVSHSCSPLLTVQCVGALNSE